MDSRNASSATEREHQEAWYSRAIGEAFFAREGFRRLIDWNLAALRRAVPVSREMRVLSIGCGLGDYEISLAPDVASIVAIDLSATAVGEARSRADGRGVANVDWIAGSALDLDFDPGAFDLVYAFGVLHHLDPAERLELLRRAHAWLTPGGWLYARDPNARGLLRRLGRGLYRRHSPFHSPDEHELDPFELVADVRTAGFERPTVDYTDVLGGPLPWLVRSRSRLLWSLVFAVDRVWLAVPGLRRLASQFAVVARR